MTRFKALISIRKFVVAALMSAAFIAPLGSSAQDSAPGTLDQTYLANQMINFDNMAQFHGYANTTGLESSKDPLKRLQYFYSNTDGGHFLRDITGASGGTEHVMVDMTGPGMLTRFFLAGPPAAGNIRIYLDGSSSPAYTHDLNDMMQGGGGFGGSFLYHAGPNMMPISGAQVPPGLDLYMPIPFQNHIVVTYDGPARGSYPVLDWIWEYTRFRPGTGVTTWDGHTGNIGMGYAPFAFQTFTPTEAQGENSNSVNFDIQPWYGNTKDPFDFSQTDSNHLWFSSGAYDSNGTVTLPPGGWVYRTYDGNGGAAFRYMRVNAGSNPDDLEKLMIDFDFRSDGGTDNGAVYESVGEFFGSGEGGLHAGQTEMQSVDNYGNLQMRWTMPFQRSGGVMLYNSGSNTIKVSMVMDVSGYNWDSNSMHFHAIRAINGPMFTYSSDKKQDGSSITKAHTMRMMYVLGKGSLVGDSETVVNGQPAGDHSFNWWGEGDELMYVDNSPFPTHRGTGSEDYFGYAYGHTYLFETPWTSQTSVPPQGYPNSLYYDLPQTVLNRVRLADAVPYNTALRYDFELHENDDDQSEVLVDHTSYFYAIPGTYTQIGNGVASLVDGASYTIQSKQNGWQLTTHGGDPATTDIPSGLGEQRFVLHATNQSGVWNITTGDQSITKQYGLQYLSCCRNTSSGASSMFLYNLNTNSGQYGSCDQQWRIRDEYEYPQHVVNQVGASGNNDYMTLVNLCGSAADVVSAGTVAGTVVQGYTDNTSQTTSGGDSSQVWRFNYVPPNFFGQSDQYGQGPAGKEDPILPNGVYQILNAVPTFNVAIDVPNASKSNGQQLQLYTNNGSPAQQWIINYIGNGIYSIINANSGLALDDGNGYNGTPAVQWYNQNVSTNQQWEFIQQYDLNVFYIKNVATGQVLSFGPNPYTSTPYSSGATLVTQPVGAVNWQTWVFQPITY